MTRAATLILWLVIVFASIAIWGAVIKFAISWIS